MKRLFTILSFALLFSSNIIITACFSSSKDNGPLQDDEFGIQMTFESFVKEKYLRDPDSYQFIDMTFIRNEDGCKVYEMKYRAKNGFGGYVVETMRIKVSDTGITPVYY